MAHEEFLVGFAQLALVLTGFVSIFVAFKVDQENRSRATTHHAVSIIVGSLVTLFAAFVPLLVFAYGLSGDALWWWSSLGFFTLSLLYFAVMMSMTLRLTRSEFMEAGVLHMALSYGLGTTAGAFCALNLVFEPLPGNYLMALVINFSVPLIAFVSFSVQKVLHW